MKTILNIEGMSCEHCVKHVTEALKGIAGVKSASVSLKAKTAKVVHNESVTLDAMSAAVVDAGFKVA